MEEGVYRVPYGVTARLGMVDLEDVAAAAAAVLLDGGHEYAIYELAGREILDQVRIAAVIAQQIGRPVRAEAIDRDQWAESARRAGQSAAAVDTLRQMFEYYERYGFFGNPTVLRALLGREPATFAQVVAHQVAIYGPPG